MTPGTVHTLHPSIEDDEDDRIHEILVDILEQRRLRQVALTWFTYAMCGLLVAIVLAVCYGVWTVASDLT